MAEMNNSSCERKEVLPGAVNAFVGGGARAIGNALLLTLPNTQYLISNICSKGGRCHGTPNHVA